MQFFVLSKVFDAIIIINNELSPENLTILVIVTLFVSSFQVSLYGITYN